MQNIIIISIISSLINDFVVRNIPAFGKITSLFVIILIIYAILSTIRENKIRQYGLIYCIFYFNIIYILIQGLCVGINLYMIKLILYNISILVIINHVKDTTISKLYNVIVVISIILSIDIIIQAIIVLSKGINMRNLRHYTLLDKQGYNMFYSFAIPILLVNTYYKKNIKNIILSILTIVCAIFFMQIKSFLYTIPLGVLLALLCLRLINIKKVINYFILSSIIFILIFLKLPINIKNQLLTPIRYYVLNDLSMSTNDSLRDLDTFEIRFEIWKNSINIIKKNPILGIGYGNYANLVEGNKITSNVTGITYDMPTVTESGVLTFILEGGLIGATLHLLIILWIIFKTIKINLCSKDTITTTIIAFVFISSNMVQDNLNYLYWCILALQIYIAKFKCYKKMI